MGEKAEEIALEQELKRVLVEVPGGRRPVVMQDAGTIIEGTEVEIAAPAGTNEARSDQDVGGRSTTTAPVYEVR